MCVFNATETFKFIYLISAKTEKHSLKVFFRTFGLYQYKIYRKLEKLSYHDRNLGRVQLLLPKPFGNRYHVN